jgi:hypothetical protein
MNARKMRRADQVRKWLYNHSLSLTFLVLFIVSVIGQTVMGLRAYNHTLGEHNQSPIVLRQYLATGDFLDAVFSNWQAAVEFVVAQSYA